MPRPKAAHPLRISAVAVAVVAIVSTADCGGSGNGFKGRPAELRVGIGPLPLTTAQNGLREIVQNLSIESLFSFAAEDGRPRPSLAEGWTVKPGWQSVLVRLRSDVKFHDGTPLKAAMVASILKRTLAATMGPAQTDFDSIDTKSDSELEIRFKTGSPFLLEALEATIEKPEPPGIGTGPYHVDPGAQTVLVANRDYYLGTPRIDRIVLSTYPSVRAAWADMLRGHIDMLYEVGADAIDSLKGATQVGVSTFTRRYQHVILFNPEASSLRSPSVRRALNLAINRKMLIEAALNNYGIASLGPVWPRHWAFSTTLPQFGFDVKAAAALLGRSRVHFTCIVPPGQPFERLALEVKRQLADVGVDMVLDEMPLDRLLDATKRRQFEAVLLDVVSGPTLFRPYLTWHSNTPRNVSGLATPKRDAALDQIRRASTVEEYREAIAAFQKDAVEDPPALFLAWSQRARAVSKRFEVPVEPGRDVLATLRLWQPVEESQPAQN